MRWGHNYNLCRKCGNFHLHPKGTLGKRLKYKKPKERAMKISKSWTEERRKLLSLRVSGDKNPAKRPEVRQKISERRKVNPVRFWLGKKRPPHTVETHEKMSRTWLKKWEDLVFSEYMISLRHRKPNKFEERIGKLVEPYGFLYVGDKKRWDFEGYDNIVVLAHGVYWHLERKGLSREVVEEVDKEKFRKLGYRCLIIWEDESDELIERKVGEFIA